MQSSQAPELKDDSTTPAQLFDAVLNNPQLLRDPATIAKLKPLVNLERDTFGLGFDRDEFVKFVLSQKNKTRWQQRVLLALREPTSPLGQICRRQLDFNQRVSVKSFWEEERRFLETIQEALDGIDVTKTGRLSLLVSNYFINAIEVKWDEVLQLVKEGANPNYGAPIQFPLYGNLITIIFSLARRYVYVDKLPKPEQLEKLLQFGLNPNDDTTLFDRHPIEDLELSALLLRYGVDQAYVNCATLFENALNFQLSHIPSFLNCEVSINNIARFTHLWLLNAKPEDITPNIRAHLKPHKKNIFIAIKGLSADKVLPILEQIVNYKTVDSALGRVFWEGHTDPSRGTLKEVFDAYRERKLAAEKTALSSEQLRVMVSQPGYSFDLSTYTISLSYADAAMQLVRAGADPGVCSMYGIPLIYRLAETNKEKYKEYIKELINHRGFPHLEIRYQGRADIEDIITFMELGADPAVFNIDKLIDAIGQLHFWNDSMLADKKKYLLQTRDPNSPLGRICRRDADKKVIKRINTMCDSFRPFEETNKKFAALLQAFSTHKTFDVKAALSLVRQGANPTRTVKAISGFLGVFAPSFGLMDIFCDTMHTAQAFSIEDLNELLTLGLDPNTANSFIPYTKNDYDYAALLLHHGYNSADGSHHLVMHDNRTISLLDSILKSVHAQPLTSINIARIYDFLHYGVPITLTQDKTIFQALLKWLEVISPQRLTPAIVDHLKKFKEQLLEAISGLSNADALKMLEKIFDDTDPEMKNNNTALGKVFWAGHSTLEKGRLGVAYKRFCALKYPEEQRERAPTLFGQFWHAISAPRELRVRLGDDAVSTSSPDDAVSFVSNNI